MTRRRALADLALVVAISLTGCGVWCGLIWLALRAAEWAGLLQAY